MRFLVLGAGSQGSYFGGMLLQAVAISLVGIGDSFGPWLIVATLLVVRC